MRYVACPWSMALIVGLALSGPHAAFGQGNKAAAEAPIKAAIVTGHDGPFHNWQETSAALAEALRQNSSMQVSIEADPEYLASPQLLDCQVVVLNYCNWQRPGLSEAAKANFLKYLGLGRGLLIVHFSNGAFHPALPGAAEGDWPEFRKICRRWWTWGKSGHDNLGRFQVEIVKDRPMLAGIAPFETEDELYFGQEGTEPIRVLATAHSKKTGRDEPIVFLYDYGPARVFQTTLGHSAASIRNPSVAEILRRGSLWAAQGPTLVIGKEAATKAEEPLRGNVEPWAHPGLRVTTGLVAWYDATAENGARRAAQLPELLYGHPVDVWHDASGNRRDLRQADAAAQPQLRIDVVMGSIRFNGRTTSLAADDLHLALDQLTALVVGTPFANTGKFQALLALNGRKANDFTSGMTLDLGSQVSEQFDALNIEGAGFSGQQRLRFEPTTFGQMRRLCVTSQIGPRGTTLYVDGKLVGQRDRAESQLALDQLTLGARYYGLGAPPTTQGFLAGEIAEVLIYDRVLNDAERASVETYLHNKYGNLRPVPLPKELVAERPVAPVKDPPPVQMFAPGFTVRKLPVETTNINNILYRIDGKLVALTYDGRILLLSDTDDDGLEDQVQVFWDKPGIVGPIGMALTPWNYPRGRGVFVACKGRILLILDKDGDGRGDVQQVVADGWPETRHPVDALGVEVAPDGSVYFGLGTNAFTNGYLLDEKKQAHYDPAGLRGTIMKVSPDFKQREIVASGIRFPVAIRLNQQGDLFCTDQEGATWLPNGNPLDELLHIQAGRHYGFPPRHPIHLPSVIDEPSVFDYAPQHQSTCGFCFDEPLPGGAMFGPPWWITNALVTGYSRGKLYRTSLVKTDRGYVADNAILASFNRLLADVCLSPRGELVATVHSGGPDWGSGPGGKGALYKIAYSDQECPQPVAAWIAAPHEVRIAFDRPLDPQAFKDLAKQVQIEYGQQVRAGDRFELFHPGYAVVQQQRESPRALLPVHSVSVTPDRRAIVLNTSEHRQAVHYAVLMPAPERRQPEVKNTLPQLPVVELTYNLNGVEAEWRPQSGDGGWQMRLPHAEWNVARTLLSGSVEGERFGQSLARPGTLTLRTQLDLWQMLRPAVQPGSTLDAQLPPEQVTVVVEAPAPFTLKRIAETETSQPVDGRHRTTWTTSPREGDWQPIEVVATTGPATDWLNISWFTRDDPRPRAFGVRRFFVPWAQWAPNALPAKRSIPELAGGNWQHGKEVFKSEKAQCAKCHRVGGEGGWIGPDLSNLVHRDYASVLRDISQPSFAINPDHLAYTLLLEDGRTLVGMVQNRGEMIAVGDIKGVETVVPRSAVEQMTPTLLSIMPEKLPEAIGPSDLKDLLTFLLLPDPDQWKPAPVERAGAPPPRRRAEVDAVLAAATTAKSAPARRLEIVLVAGPKDHGPGEHDYPLWQDRWSRLLSNAPEVRVSVADLWPSPAQWQTADCVVVFSANQGWSPERARQMDEFFARGGGMVYLHYAVNGQRAPDELAARIGLAWQPGKSKFRHGPLDLQFATAKNHPITAGFTSAQFVDESYWNLLGDVEKVTVLATQQEEDAPRPMLWTCEPGQGRVFVSLLGHYTSTFDDPLFRVLLLRGMAWTTDQPSDRFNDLIYLGASVQGR